jgi:hypothetical protein
MSYTKFILLIALSFLQISGNAETIKGKIIRQKDTLSVDFLINLGEGKFTQYAILESLQNGVDYRNGGEFFLKPDDALAIEFELNGSKICMVSVSNTLGAIDYSKPIPNVFLHSEIDGKAKLLNFYFQRENNGNGIGIPLNLNDLIAYTVVSAIQSNRDLLKLNVLKKGNLPLICFSKLKFKKTGAYYFKDCPELAEKIKKKVYTLDDLPTIVSIYNTTCGK